MGCHLGRMAFVPIFSRQTPVGQSQFVERHRTARLIQISHTWRLPLYASFARPAQAYQTTRFSGVAKTSLDTKTIVVILSPARVQTTIAD